MTDYKLPSDWDKLTAQQQADMQAWRDRTCQLLNAETEAFYKEHPELQLTWSLTSEPLIRHQAEPSTPASSQEEG